MKAQTLRFDSELEADGMDILAWQDGHGLLSVYMLFRLDTSARGM